jgi:hypothetical protein
MSDKQPPPSYFKMHEQAKIALEPWVKPENILAVYKRYEDTYLVVERRQDLGSHLKYSLYAVFRMGNGWSVSVDAQDVSADGVLVALQRRMS